MKPNSSASAKDEDLGFTAKELKDFLEMLPDGAICRTRHDDPLRYADFYHDGENKIVIITEAY